MGLSWALAELQTTPDSGKVGPVASFATLPTSCPLCVPELHSGPILGMSPEWKTLILTLVQYGACGNLLVIQPPALGDSSQPLVYFHTVLLSL